jgi:hypothetical protein
MSLKVMTIVQLPAPAGPPGTAGPCWPCSPTPYLPVLAITTRATGTTPIDRILMTRKEIRHLFAALLIRPTHDIWHQLRWSTWRRRHQHRAKTSHYQRRNTKPSEPAVVRYAPAKRGHNELRLEY